MDDDTRRINRLLSDGKLSGPESDEILQRVFEQLEREKPRRPVRAIRYFAGAALAAAAALLLVVYLPRDPGGQVAVPEMGDVAPRVLSVTCSPGELSACPMSSKLVFSVSERASGFLSAYAEPVEHDAARVFFFSKEDGGAELAAPADATHASERAVRLAGPLKPGRYRVHAILADRALGREEMVAGAAAPTGGAEIRAVARVELVVTE